MGYRSSEDRTIVALLVNCHGVGDGVMYSEHNICDYGLGAYGLLTAGLFVEIRSILLIYIEGVHKSNEVLRRGL